MNARPRPGSWRGESRVKTEWATRPVPVCPKCGRPAQEWWVDGALRAACCHLYSFWRRPLATRQDHDARWLTHLAFDRLWKEADYPEAEKGLRREAYRLLEELLGVPQSDDHIGTMNVAECQRVMDLLPEIRERMITSPALPAVMTRHLWGRPKPQPESPA